MLRTDSPRVSKVRKRLYGIRGVLTIGALVVVEYIRMSELKTPDLEEQALLTCFHSIIDVDAGTIIPLDKAGVRQCASKLM